MKTNFLLFLSTILFLSCSEKSPEVELIKQKTIELQLETFENFSVRQHMLIGEKEYLVCFDSSKPALRFYNINSGLREMSVPLALFPDYKFPNYYSYIISEDSILVLNSNEVFLIDSLGDLHTKWNFDNYDLTKDRGLLASFRFPLRLINKKIICNSPYIGVRIITKAALKEYYSKPIVGILEVGQDELKSVKYFGYFPKSYTDSTKDFYDIAPSWTVNSGNNIILSFGKDHGLYVYDDNGNFKKEVIAKSKFIDHFNELSEGKSKDFSFLKRYMTIEPEYENIIYDQFNDMYFRVVKHRIDDYENEDGTVKTKFDSRFSIMFIDTDMNIMGENIFDTNEYYITGLMPTKQGLMILKNTNSAEKKYVFDFFKVVSK